MVTESLSHDLERLSISSETSSSGQRTSTFAPLASSPRHGRDSLHGVEQDETVYAKEDLLTPTKDPVEWAMKRGYMVSPTDYVVSALLPDIPESPDAPCRWREQEEEEVLKRGMDHVCEDSPLPPIKLDFGFFSIQGYSAQLG